MSHNKLIGRLLYSYHMYFIFLPYLLFWFSYIGSILKIFYYKIRFNYNIIYFPDESNSFIANFLIILPQRMGFNAIYYYDKTKLFSWKNIFHLLKVFFIIFILGIPFIFIKIFLSYLNLRNIWHVWDAISPYTNNKIIISQSEIIRNMKKIGDNYKKWAEVNDSIIPTLKTGMKTLKKGTHLVGYSKESHIGGTYSTKPDKNYGEKIIVEGSDKSVLFIQKFDNSPLDKIIINPKLYSLTKTRLPADILKAHLIYKESETSMVILNKEKNQIWIAKTREDMLLANKFIKDHTKNDEVLLNFLEFEQYKNNIISDAEKLLLSLSNSDKEKKYIILNKNKSVYDSLKVLSESKYTNVDYVKELLLKIEQLI